MVVFILKNILNCSKCGLKENYAYDSGPIRFHGLKICAFYFMNLSKILKDFK